jgi:hypothetical protein
MSDDEELAELRREVEKGDRLDEDARREETAAFRERVREALEEIDTGERQKTVSVWDGPLAAFMTALEDTEDLEAIGEALQGELGLEEDAEGLDRSEVIRLALRLGLREAAPEYLDAAREAVREHNTPDL